MFGMVSQQNQSINQEGIGLGLYITKNLVTQMGGTIDVESREHEYTKFTVTLPIKRAFKVPRQALTALKQRKADAPNPEVLIRPETSI